MNNDTHGDDPQRDPRLAQLLAAASREEPPAALDAAILAAARREVSSRPQVVGTAGGGGGTSTPPARAKRNWYVPVSIAAVLVLSVSLVRVMQEEKGDELSQPPTVARSLPKAATAPAAAPAPVAPEAVAKPDAVLKDAVPAQPAIVESQRAGPAGKIAETTAAPDRYAESRNQRAEEAEAAPGGAVAPAEARKDQAVGVLMREQRGPAVADTAPRPAPAPSISGMVAGGAPTPVAPAPAAPAAPVAERRPEPFPATGTRETPAAAATPAPAAAAPAATPPSRDAQEAQRDADRAVARSAAKPRPATPADDGAALSGMMRQRAPESPQAAGAAGRSGSVTLGARGSSQEPITGAASAPAAESAPRVEDRVFSAPPPAPQAKAAPPPPAKKAAIMQQRLPVWRGLEDQPPEKWLERLAEFKRDNRQADADELLAEFRRRFPDHPASAR